MYPILIVMQVLYQHYFHLIFYPSYIRVISKTIKVLPNLLLMEHDGWLHHSVNHTFYPSCATVTPDRAPAFFFIHFRFSVPVDF